MLFSNLETLLAFEATVTLDSFSNADYKPGW
jgi:hypothetical protein